jgi:hypothetical protein
MNIQFSPDLINILPKYLSTNWQNLIQESKFKFTKSYVYNAITTKTPISIRLNEELNRVWNDLELTYSDLEVMYSLISTIQVGALKYKKYIGGHANGEN